MIPEPINIKAIIEYDDTLKLVTDGIKLILNQRKTDSINKLSRIEKKVLFVI